MDTDNSRRPDRAGLIRQRRFADARGPLRGGHPLSVAL
jgi:hypothetical protein